VRGTSFYDRAEIRDLASWLRLLVNPHGDGDFVRAVGAVPRGIGDTTLEKLTAHARTQGVSLYTAASDGAPVPGLSPAARGKLSAFAAQLETLRQRASSAGAGPLARAVAQESGFLDRLGADPRGEGEERLQNVQEFLRAADEFDATWSSVTGEAEGPALPVAAGRRAALLALRGDDDTPAPSALEAFLAQLAVLGAADESVDGERVSLMTLHTAKGLEFDTVVLAGMEERIFPTARALGDNESIAEERRLCYVGMTRARRRLHLLLARNRALFGEAAWNRPSRFLYELPQEHVRGLEALPREDAGEAFDDGLSRWQGAGNAGRYRDASPSGSRPSLRAPVTQTSTGLSRGTSDGSSESRVVYDTPEERPAPRLRPPGSGSTIVRDAPGELARGTTVRHAVFGEGRVLTSQGSGDAAKVTVHFPAVGPKVVIARHLQSV